MTTPAVPAAEWIAGSVGCPRCGHFPGFFVNVNGTTVICSRCEWQFTLSAIAVMSTPSMPGSTTPVTNTGGPAAVTISAGTLTYVYVNGVQVGTADGTYGVPAGGTISITYSVAPTWSWAAFTLSSAVAAGATALPVTAGGTAFAAGQVLLVDTGSSAEVISVSSAPSGTSVPVSGAAPYAPGLARAHGSGTSFGVLAVASAYGTAAGMAAVPNNPGWGF